MDLSHVYTKKYENKWVALTPNYKSVLASSSDFGKLFRKWGDKDITYMRVPDLNKDYVYYGA